MFLNGPRAHNKVLRRNGQESSHAFTDPIKNKSPLLELQSGSRSRTLQISVLRARPPEVRSPSDLTGCGRIKQSLETSHIVWEHCLQERLFPPTHCCGPGEAGRPVIRRGLLLRNLNVLLRERIIQHPNIAFQPMSSYTTRQEHVYFTFSRVGRLP